MNAFVTGSRAYGKPKYSSDIDLVVLVSFEDLERLKDKNEEPFQDDYGFSPDTTACLRFGGLNLICVTSQRDYDLWVQGTRELKAKGPVEREEALEHFQKLRIEAYGSLGGV